jgi:type II secretory pathway pseudopilin PulG
MKKYCRNYKKYAGFTLIEALFAIAIAGGVLAFVFGYFTDSMRGVSHSEETLATIKTAQMLSTKLRDHVYALSPFSGAPIEQLHSDRDPIALIPRNYANIVYRTDSPTSSSPIPVNATKVRWLKEGPMFKSRENWDPFFQEWFKKGVINMGAYAKYRDSTATIEREIDIPYPSTKVIEFHFYHRSKIDGAGEHLMYRHYLGSKNKPMNYVTLYKYDKDEKKPIEIESFGKTASGSGRILSFSVTPLFEFTRYKPHRLSPPVLSYVKMILQVHILFKGQKKGYGPDGRNIDVSFNISDPFSNSDHWRKGQF